LPAFLTSWVWPILQKCSYLLRNPSIWAAILQKYSYSRLKTLLVRKNGEITALLHL
jgi:hypothetical protein